MKFEDDRFAYRMFVAAGIIAAVALLLLLVWYIAYVLLLLFAGALMAIFFRGLARWVSRGTGLSEGWSLLGVVIALSGLTFLAVWLMGSDVVDQAENLAREIPKAVEQMREQADRRPWSRYLLDRLPDPERFTSAFGDLARRAAGWFSTTLGAVTAFIIILFLAIYMAADPGLYINGIIRLVPIDKRERAREVLSTVGFALHWWLIGKFISMMIIGVLTGVGLWLLGIPLALVLGVLAALLTFIPNIGPVLSAIPAVLLALMISLPKAGYVILLYVVIQAVESYLLTPLIQQRTVSLPPVLTLIFQIVMGILMGLPGLILATPLAAAMLVVVKMIYVEDILGDHIDVPGSGNG